MAAAAKNLPVKHSSCMKCNGCRENKACDLLWLIYLNIVMRTWHEEEIRCWKEFVKTPGDAYIQVWVARAEDDPHWSSERVHLRNPLRPISHSEKEILVQAKESRLGTGCGHKLVIE